MFDRRIKYASDFAGKRLSHVEEARPDGNERSDENHNRRYRNHYVRLINRIRYPSYRVRGIYGIILLVAFYTTIAPALVALTHNYALDLDGGVDSGAAAALDLTYVTPKAKVKTIRKTAANNGGPRPTAPGEHKIENGRLVVDLTSKIHPMNQLIRDARSNWDQKVGRQSKTLKEADEEYRRRYKRAPPAGFDKWWAYVVENKVQLPDEYDMINKDLQLFWGLSSRDVRHRNEKASKWQDTFTLKVQNGMVDATKHYRAQGIHDKRFAGQLGVMNEIAEYLPDMTVVYSVHDTPRTVISWEHRQDILLQIEDGVYISENDEVEGTYHGWGAACPFASPLNKRVQKFVSIPPSDVEHKSFIWSHTDNMDICQNPEMIPLHGLLAGKDHYVKELSTLFSLSKTSLHADILGVPTERVVKDVPLIPWEEKNRDQLLWRGGNTAMHYGKNTPWQQSQRVRLIALANAEKGDATVLAAPGTMNGKSVADSAARKPNSALNRQYMDIAFVNRAIQCEVKDGTCDEINDNYAFRSRVSPEDLDNTKYLLDVDGNAWSARFQRLMISGSLVFKSTIIPEWWNDRVQPWVHYVPVKLDYTDLYDALTFFAGDLEGNGGADDLAQEIAGAGRDWSMKYYRHEDMVAYAFRLYLEWARLQKPDRSGAAFKYDLAMEVRGKQ